ncbi:MAG: hypothetical protein PUE90_04130 [Bacteroidales bacterium]|nr:hypothetical protein [Bacteroidales bacterium]MDD6668682.1 hypothetical protein [Bacteroidales bacterium]
MFWVILIIIVVGVFYYSYKHVDYNDIYEDYNRNNSDSDEDNYTYFDDISDDDIEYDYLEREEQRREEEDEYYINQRNK